MEAENPTEDQQRQPVAFFSSIDVSALDRRVEIHLQLLKESVEKLGVEDGTVLGLSAVFLDRDALFRPELVETGTP